MGLVVLVVVLVQCWAGVMLVMLDVLVVLMLVVLVVLVGEDLNIFYHKNWRNKQHLLNISMYFIRKTEKRKLHLLREDLNICYHKN